MWQVPVDGWGDGHGKLDPLDLAAELERWPGVATGRLATA